MIFQHPLPHQTGTPNFTSAREKLNFPYMFQHPTPHPVKQLEHFQAHSIVSLLLNITTCE